MLGLVRMATLINRVASLTGQSISMGRINGTLKNDYQMHGSQYIEEENGRRTYINIDDIKDVKGNRLIRK